MTTHQVVSQEEWLAARRALLAKEKELTHQRDALARERLQLPWVRMETNYAFEGPNGRETLSDLFGNHSQLLVYHFMFGPDWKEGCPSCSLVADHIDPTLVHLAARDVSFAVVSRAPYQRLADFQKRMGWQFHWVSSFHTTFNEDFHVSFDAEEFASGKVEYNFGRVSFPQTEAPGTSVFYKDESGTVFHTYSTYARGVEPQVGVYSYLDIAPKGRDEGGLDYPMRWVRYHDKYEHEQASTCCGAEAKAGVQ